MAFWCETVWAAEAEGGATIPEAPSAITVLLRRLGEGPVHDWLHAWENVVFALLIAVGLGMTLLWMSRRRALIPSGPQNAAELIVETFEQAFIGNLGPHTRRFLPFLGTLFLYILAMNWAVLIPGLKSPTGGFILSHAKVISGGFVTTAALALCVFLYVQYTAIRSHGLLAYLHHLMGSPRTPAEVFLCVMTLAPVTHILGELIRPISLTLRLFGNVTGDDILLGVFFVVGMMSLQALHVPIGLPLHILVVPLVLLFGFVQAVIFTWLTSAYLSLSLGHGDSAQHGGGH
ncbi:MAG: F0F1 ATP synthase subunit A [Candidatus Omnitrophica bacterium]|nr:F0F1 ATP synthase subunit A [Candidatus Omnitrophota bacterium]